MADKEEIPISTLNKMIGNVQNFYYALVDKGWYLPPYGRGAITFQYLWNVFSGTCFRIPRQEIKRAFTYKKISKIEVFQELNTAVQNIGFSSEKLPEKQWMLDVLNTVNPKHRIFSKESGPIDEPKVTISMKELKSLDLTFVKGNKTTLFKMNPEQKRKRQEFAENKDIERAKRRSEFYEGRLEKTKLNLLSKKIKREGKIQDQRQPFMFQNLENDEARSISMH